MSLIKQRCATVIWSQIGWISSESGIKYVANSICQKAVKIVSLKTIEGGGSVFRYHVTMYYTFKGAPNFTNSAKKQKLPKARPS